MNRTFTPTLPTGGPGQARSLRRPLPDRLPPWPARPIGRSSISAVCSRMASARASSPWSPASTCRRNSASRTPTSAYRTSSTKPTGTSRPSGDATAPAWPRASPTPRPSSSSTTPPSPSRAKHSVGVQRQHCGALGKKANCQAAVSVHYAAPKGHCPLAMRLYLPESWLGDSERLDKAGVPAPSREMKTKGQIALELLDQVQGEDLPGRVVVADAGYGVSKPFRDGLSERGLCYVVGVTEEMVVFTRGAALDRAGALAGRSPPDPATPGRGSPPPGQPQGTGLAAAPPGADLASRDQGGPDGQVLLDPGLAGAGLGHRRLRRGRGDLAADRGAGRRDDQVCLLEPAGRDVKRAWRAAVAEPLAGGDAPNRLHLKRQVVRRR